MDELDEKRRESPRVDRCLSWGRSLEGRKKKKTDRKDGSRIILFDET